MEFLQISTPNWSRLEWDHTIAKYLSDIIALGNAYFYTTQSEPSLSISLFTGTCHFHVVKLVNIFISTDILNSKSWTLQHGFLPGAVQACKEVPAEWSNRECLLQTDMSSKERTGWRIFQAKRIFINAGTRWNLVSYFIRALALQACPGISKKYYKNYMFTVSSTRRNCTVWAGSYACPAHI